MTDPQLIANVLNGNTESFRFLYRKHSSAAWNMAMYVCQNEVLAKDAMQVGFTSAFKYLSTYSNQSTFKTWLLRIVHNEAIRIMKYENRYSWDEGDIGLRISSETDGIEMKLERESTRAQIDKVLDRMKETEALVLKMFYLQELKMTEIAEIINKKEGAVKVTLHRARLSFQKIVEKNHGQLA